MYRINKMLLYLILLLFMIIDVTVVNRIAIKGARPDLIIILVIFFGLFYGRPAGLTVGLVLGFIIDILNINFFGTNILLFSALGLVCGALSDKIYRENFFTQFVLTFIVTFLFSKFYLFNAVYTAILSPVIILILRFICGHFPLPVFSK